MLLWTNVDVEVILVENRRAGKLGELGQIRSHQPLTSTTNDVSCLVVRGFEGVMQLVR